MDLRPWCAPVEDQGSVGSCTAQAVVGALEYFERKTRGQHVDASRLFLYRATRRYLGWEGRGDTGAFVRSAIKALRLFGTLPEAYWPYDEQKFDDEPEAFHYAFAQNFRAIEYYRVPENVDDLKEVLRAGIPFAFGFTCFSSLFSPEVIKTGVIPYPSDDDSVEGGHAVLAVGFSDSHVLIRNSWGTSWGEAGYGRLPWSYFDSRKPLATDCWILINASWMSEDEGEELDRRAGTRHLAAVRTESARTEPQRGGAPAPKRPRTENLKPRVRVTRGNDPTRATPLRFSAGALKADAAVPVALAKSQHPVALYLKNIDLLDSFDWSLFGNATNELYSSAIVWDLSGQPPRVFPPAQLDPAGARTYQLEQNQRVSFVGDGLQLWPLSNVVGGLYVRLVIMESDKDVQQIGARLAEVHKAVKSSPLVKALEVLGTAAGVAAPQLAAVGAAADVLTSLIAAALQANGDDMVALFDGTYGVENLRETRTDEYTQGGARIELDLTLAK